GFETFAKVYEEGRVTNIGEVDGEQLRDYMVDEKYLNGEVDPEREGRILDAALDEIPENPIDPAPTPDPEPTPEPTPTPDPVPTPDPNEPGNENENGTEDDKGTVITPGKEDRKSTRLNSSHVSISYAVFCLK